MILLADSTFGRRSYAKFPIEICSIDRLEIGDDVFGALTLSFCSEYSIDAKRNG